ncbi:MAG: hypothetical protein KY443_09275, partial [Actinobacteria bacterium]|nr:hypothetical protein [Actinomycetota bacterium]
MPSTLFFVLGARARRAVVVVFVAMALVVGLVPAVRGVGDVLAPQLPVVTPPGTELVGLRTATTKTFATATPGKYRTKAFSTPVHFKNDFGLWDEIDTTLVPSVEPARFVTAGNSAILDVAADPTSPELVRYRLDDEHSIGFRLAGARPGAPAVPAGPKVTYGGILPHVDLRLTTTNQGVKEELVLASPAAADRFVFPLALDGLTASVNEAGEVVYRDADGRERAVTPNGFMEDADVDPHTDSGAVSHDVRYAVIPWEGGQALEVTVDRAWLDDPARVYPVVVDPTYWLSTTWSDDTYVMSNYVRDNSWDAELKVGTYDGGSHVGISFMHFDVGGLSGKIIDSARFEAWNNHSWSCQARGMGVYRVTQGWDGRTMTGYPGASLGERVAWAAFAMGYEPGGCSDGWAGFDVLGTVRNWTSGAWCMCGLAMKVDPGSETDNYAWKNFASWDATGGGWATPNIDIYWSEPNRAPYTPDSLSPANGHKSTTTPGLSARYSDPDGNNGRLYFRVRDSSGAQVTGGWSSYVCSGCGASWGPPSLAEGVYYWETYAQDDQGATSGWSGTHSFTVDPTAPNPPSMSSSTHPDQSAWYSNNSATVSWAATDTSGISGYSRALDQTADTTSEGTDTSATFGGLSDGVHFVSARAVNGTGLWSNPASFTVQVDTAKPTGPTAVTSDHAPYVASADRTVEMNWDGAVDATSGVAGYSWIFNRSYSTPADTSNDGNLTSTTSAELSDGDWYFHVRAVDRAGNVGDDKVYGPVRIDGAAALGGLTSANEAQSDQVGLEQFAPYDDFDLGTGTGYVHLGTGNAVAAFEDATVPGQGLNVVIRHTYNSQRAKIDNGLGKGWSLSVTDLDGGLDDVEGAVTDIDLNRELTPLEVGSVVDGVFQVTGFQLEFTDGDGTTHRFVRKGGPGARWDSPPGVSLRVREILDSNLLVTAYELIRPDGVVYRAERPAGLTVPSWRIVSITDRNGNQLTYTHAEVGTTTPKSVRLTDIRHNRYPTESAATFAYDSVGHLSRITTLPGVTAADPATGTSRSWTRTIDFAVNATTGLLTSYTENTHALPAGATAATRTTSFGYDSATEVLNAVTDGRGDTTTLGYGVENGRQILTSVTDRENKAWTWTYGAVDATTGERTTTARTPLGHTTQYRISGRSPVDAPGDLRVTGGNILEIRDAGNDSGPVVDSFDWKANRLVSKTNGVGAVTTYEYNDLGLLTKVVEPAPNDPGQSAPEGAPREP